jgi:hypothetical protein
VRLSPTIAANMPLLHALKDAPEDATVSGVSQQIGRDKSNLAKTLKSLREEGVVGEGVALTDAGRALTGVLSADGVLNAGPADVVFLQHDEIEPDPENERHDFDDPDSPAWEALEAFSVDLVQRDLIQPLQVSAPTEPGGKYRIIAGERRWRAVGLAIERDDWAARFGHGGGTGGLRCIVRRGLDARARAFLRLAENLQRQDLHPLDEGEAYAKLTHLPFGMSPVEIGEEIGKSDRHVANRIAVFERLGDADKARMRLSRDDDNYLTWRGALSIIQNHKPKPAFDLAPNEAVVVLELAAFAEAKPSRNLYYPAADGWTQTPKPPAGDAFNALMRRDLIVSAEHDGRNFDPDWFACLNRTGDLQAWINLKVQEGGGYEGAIWSARCAALGAISATMLRDSDRWATPWLNAELPPAEPETATAPETVSPPLGEELRHPSPMTAAPATEPTHAPSPDRSTVSGSVPPPEPALSAPELTPSEAEALRELAGKLDSQGQDFPGGRRAKVYEYWLHKTDLVSKRVVAFTQAGPQWFAHILPLGRAWIDENGYAPAESEKHEGEFATPWLNPPAPAATAAETKVPGPLGPMLGDSFAQQIKAAREEEPLPDDWSFAIRECLTISIDEDRLKLTAVNQIAGKDATIWLTQEEVHRLWAELGFAHARIGGDA